jgi:signal transduction histidine kinase
MESMERRWGTDGFDTVRYLINDYSELFIEELSALTDDSTTAEKKKYIYDLVLKVLEQEQDLSGYLSFHFARQGVEKDFNHKIVINYLELLGPEGGIPIYTSEDLLRRRPPAPGQQPDNEEENKKTRPSSEILIKGYRSEDNLYRLDFDYYIDFSDKQRVILRETSASLIMSILSIMVVVALFMTTYRNLMEEKRLSDLKTDFINNMTHELKTPLSTITVAGKTLEIPQIRANDSKILETAKLIGKQSVHLNQLINMILEISMWERTQFQVDRKNVNMDELLNDIIESFRTGCNNCAEVSVNINLRDIYADVDVVYFTTLINNLLSNAVKYSDRDPVIKVDALVENDIIMIKVADNGIGIGRNDQKHIFDKFYRASTGNIHKFKGLGLGLYYVKKIANAHGGDVTVSSKPGKGSIFTISIPLKQ